FNGRRIFVVESRYRRRNEPIEVRNTRIGEVDNYDPRLGSVRVADDVNEKE
ncbi:hypothetical protein PIB30_077434, partial [Stylosanthes scabra]|nr:hypothetical protein [Stylosanthes scabra]